MAQRAPAPIHRGQGNDPFRSEGQNRILARGQVVPYDINGAPTGGAVADGDYGDIIVSSAGAAWNFDATVVTAFARTFLDDADATAVRATIGAPPTDLFTATTNGLVPASGGGTANYLRADGTWTGVPVASHSHAIADVTGLQAALDGKQPLDSDLTALAANITTFGHSLVDDADAAAGRTTLGLGTIATAAKAAALTDLTVTATAGTLPTADDSVTIADAAAPTNVELLEYCRELEAKLETLMANHRTAGIQAT